MQRSMIRANENKKYEGRGTIFIEEFHSTPSKKYWKKFGRCFSFSCVRETRDKRSVKTEFGQKLTTLLRRKNSVTNDSTLRDRERFES